MTRAELRNAIYECTAGLSRAERHGILSAVFEEISAALLRGEAVKLRGFGSFEVRETRARVGRNPKTGVEAHIPARRVIVFSASTTLVARLNGESMVAVPTSSATGDNKDI